MRAGRPDDGDTRTRRRPWIRFAWIASSALAAVTLTTAILVAGSHVTGAVAEVTLPPADGGFSYQLGGAYPPENGVLVVSRDRAAPPAGAGFYDICYVNLLQTQPDEEGQSETDPPSGTTQWWMQHHPDLLLTDEAGRVVVDADWDEALFDVRTAQQRARLLAIQDEWFRDCAAAGFDAIEPDNLDAFLRSEGLLSFAQTKEYLKLVVPRVHGLGLAIAQKNTSDAPDGYGGIGATFVDTATPAQGFDFAIAEECAAYDECAAYTDVYGPLVFEIEYSDADPLRVRDGVARSAFAWICLDDGADRSIILRDRDLRAAGEPGHLHQGC